MYTGTLIDDLIAAVERAERRTEEWQSVPPDYWYPMMADELLQAEQNLVEVA